MKKSRFSDEQIVKSLSSVTDGITVREVCQSHGVSENTFYTWKRKYAGMESDDIRKLKDIKSENQALKQIVADQALLIEASKKLLRKNGLRPPTEGRGPALMSNGTSKRKACQFIGITRLGLDLPLKDTGDDLMKESILAIWRPNMGYRMLHTLLLKVFPGINIKRTYRLWKELRLGRVKRYRKKRTGTPVPYAATMANDVWTSIIHDSCMRSASSSLGASNPPSTLRSEPAMCRRGCLCAH